MMTILLEQREFLRATHLLRHIVPWRWRSDRNCERVSLTALLLKGQSDCEISAAKIWPPSQGPVRLHQA